MMAAGTFIDQLGAANAAALRLARQVAGSVLMWKSAVHPRRRNDGCECGRHRAARCRQPAVSTEVEARRWVLLRQSRHLRPISSDAPFSRQVQWLLFGLALLLTLLTLQLAEYFTIAPVERLPHACFYCSRSFRLFSDLQRHNRQDHRGTAF